jgi:hypothetical protein
MNIVLMFGTWYSYTEYSRLKELSLELDAMTALTGNLMNSYQTWMGIGSTFGILAAICLVVTLFMFNRIRIAVTIMEEATKVFFIF